MVKIKDRILVESEKVGTPPRSGVVTATQGSLVRVKWDDGTESSFLPGAGSLTIVQKATNKAIPKATKKTIRKPAKNTIPPKATKKTIQKGTKKAITPKAAKKAVTPKAAKKTVRKAAKKRSA